MEPSSIRSRKQDITGNTTGVRPRDWRCTCCAKLLGRRLRGHIHVEFARGHQYMVSAPVSAICCRSCGTLNAIKS